MGALRVELAELLAPAMSGSAAALNEVTCITPDLECTALPVGRDSVSRVPGAIVLVVVVTGVMFLRVLFAEGSVRAMAAPSGTLVIHEPTPNKSCAPVRVGGVPFRVPRPVAIDFMVQWR